MLNIILLSAALILVHDWYPKECCEERHCKAVNCAEISSLGDYWYWDSYRIEKWKAKPSMDGACHVCTSDNGVMLCIFLGGQS